jgi:hypothetical protein
MSVKPPRVGVADGALAAIRSRSLAGWDGWCLVVTTANGIRQQSFPVHGTGSSQPASSAATRVVDGVQVSDPFLHLVGA